MQGNRLRWFGEVGKRESDCVGKRMPRMELPRERPGGRPKRRFLDTVKADIMVVDTNEEDAEDRVRWKLGRRKGGGGVKGG